MESFFLHSKGSDHVSDGEFKNFSQSLEVIVYMPLLPTRYCPGILEGGCIVDHGLPVSKNSSTFFGVLPFIEVAVWVEYLIWRAVIPILPFVSLGAKRPEKSLPVRLPPQSTQSLIPKFVALCASSMTNSRSGTFPA